MRTFDRNDRKRTRSTVDLLHFSLRQNVETIRQIFRRILFESRRTSSPIRFVVKTMQQRRDELISSLNEQLVQWEKQWRDRRTSIEDLQIHSQRVKRLLVGTLLQRAARTVDPLVWSWSGELVSNESNDLRARQRVTWIDVNRRSSND